MKNMKTLKVFLAILIAVTIVSCSKDKEEVRVNFLLTDAPSYENFQEVNIDIREVHFSTNEGWDQLAIQPAIYNLLDLTNGLDTLLAHVYLDEGTRINQVRLVLGPNNSVKTDDGIIHSLATPSANTSGLKVNVHQNANVESEYSIMIDFDASRSIVQQGNGDYSLKPVIRSYMVQNTSYIDGNIVPGDVPYKVFVTAGQDTISTLSDPLINNYFRIHGLFSGTYTLKVQDLNNDMIIKDTTINVVGGRNVILGNFYLPVTMPM
ncbi:MAG TPA: hypothetical protein DD434_01720 [Bacteroidales bacterium]|nr:hypothetical protein [Bacteroidales bacterium]